MLHFPPPPPGVSRLASLWAGEGTHVWFGDRTGQLPSWEGQCFVLTGRVTYSGYGFAFFACNTCAKITNRGLAERLTHPPGIPHSTASDQGTLFAAKGEWQGPLPVEFAGLTMSPPS